VVERNAEIGEPVRTSGGTSIEFTRSFGIPEALYHPISRVRFVGPNSDAAFDYSDPVMCVLDVRNTYRYLAEQAVENGAVVRTGHQAVATRVHDGRVVGCDEISAAVTIDASGYRSVVSKQSGLHPGFTRFGVGSEYELAAPRCRQDEAVLIVGRRWAPAGYAWVFPWGGDRVRFGVGVHHADVHDDPHELLDALVEGAAAFGVDLSGAGVREVHRGLIPADEPPERLVGDGVLAVGDAACQATLVVGEGIRIAMIAGTLAGDVAAQAVASGNVTREGLAPYERDFRAAYADTLALGRALNERIAAYDDHDWDEALRLLATMPPALVANLLQSQPAATST
jgi:digeranylgeranylglycerophospholipid reductase